MSCRLQFATPSRVASRRMPPMKHVGKRSERLSTLDDVTGLYRREAVEERLQRIAKAALRRKGQYAVVTMALNEFESIETQLGPWLGDRHVLRSAAARLQKEIRDTDICGRWGADFLHLCHRSRRGSASGRPICGQAAAGVDLRTEVGRNKLPSPRRVSARRSIHLTPTPHRRSWRLRSAPWRLQKPTERPPLALQAPASSAPVRAQLRTPSAMRP